MLCRIVFILLFLIMFRTFNLSCLIFHIVFKYLFVIYIKCCLWFKLIVMLRDVFYFKRVFVFYLCRIKLSCLKLSFIFKKCLIFNNVLHSIALFKYHVCVLNLRSCSFFHSYSMFASQAKGRVCFVYLFVLKNHLVTCYLFFITFVVFIFF